MLQEKIAKANYTKQADLTIQKNGVDYVTTAYRLDLTGAEFYTVIAQLLETLKQDSITLNLVTTKAKAIGLGENYTNINQFNTTIDGWIKNCEQKAQNGNTEGISFVVYAYKGEAVLTEVIVKNQIKMSMDYRKEKDTKTYTVTLENLSADDTYTQAKIEFSQTSAALQTINHIHISVDEETQIDLTITHNGAASQNSLTTNWDCVVTDNGNETTLSYTQEMKFVEEVTDMIKIDNTNCAILNDYGTDQLNQLITALTERIAYLFNQKLQMVGLASVVQNPMQQDYMGTDGQNVNQ